jgi:L-iditol 2-dehydrogenase
MKTMKAVVKYGRSDGEVEIRDVPEPALLPHQVMIEVAAVGVCGSDIHLWHEKQSWPIKLPVILGHEFCGRIVELGQQASGFELGERVVVETAAEICGTCIYCLSGNYNMCPRRRGYGNLLDGAMTRYVPARTQILHRIPENVSFEQAALTEPISVANKALIEKSNIHPGDTVVVQGAGAIGILAAKMALLCGAGTVLVLGTNIDAHRLEIAKQLGVHYTLNVQKEDPLELIRSIGDGYGANLVVDCTGVSAAFQQSMQLVRPLGAITKIGWGPQPLNFNIDPLVAKAVTLQGSFSHTYATWDRSLRLISTGQLDISPVIGGVYPLENWEEAFSTMESGKNIKSVLINV